MDRFRADQIKVPPAVGSGAFTKADLVFYGVEHRGPSFEARVFLNAAEARIDTALELDAGYAGSFVVFGHAGCYGDEGHCHVPPGSRDPFDRRPPHGMTPFTKFVDVTEALSKAHIENNEIGVIVVPMVPGRVRAREGDVLFFTGLNLLAYR